ncbi:MAG: hypothetical protein C4344_01020 [Acidimicrobiia bacterium]
MTPVVALAGPQMLGIAIVVATLVGWAVYGLVVLGRPERPPGSEITDAPNRKPYLGDDELEGPKLDRVLKWCFYTTAFIAIALPVYWLNEPNRQAGAERGFEKRSIQRGAELFQSTSAPVPPGHIAAGCADCHGAGGVGGGVSYVLQDPVDPTRVIPVTWEAPSLNDVMYRFSPDEVRRILEYGRPGTPMPAWGVNGGGALGDQQLDDLVNYLISIQISPKEVLAKSAKVATGTNPGDGKKLFDAFCARCHTLGWSYRDSYKEPTAKDGGGAFGPNLRDGDTLRQFPTEQAHIDFITLGSDANKPYGRRGIGTGRMPGFGVDPATATASEKPQCVGGVNAHCTTYRFGPVLTKQQIRAIVEYERSL